MSLGLPVAYLANLLLLHVPGAVAKVFDRTNLFTLPIFTRTGIILTAIGSVSFVFGVWVAHSRATRLVPKPAVRSLFWRYCTVAGGIATVIGYTIHIPSIGAVFQRGGAIWMLGVMLGLMTGLMRHERTKAIRWFIVLAIYPVLMLLIGGFLSFGSMAAIIVLSALFVTTESPWRITLATLIALVLGMNFFVSYFAHRGEIRAAVWGGADSNARISAAMAAVRDMRMIDPRDPMALYAIDQRLNQNYFVGLAAARIQSGDAHFLYGRSLIEGAQALIPRALWPEKPVVAGSPKIVAEMTGLTLSEGTSFGVGNVMEFDINFGIPGVILGFLILGWVLGTLDRRSAEENMLGNMGQIPFYFLPAVALIQPNGSLVDIMSAVAGSVAAAYLWRWSWARWPKPISRAQMRIRTGAEPLPS
jgi:hypothetical protein